MHVWRINIEDDILWAAYVGPGEGTAMPSHESNSRNCVSHLVILSAFDVERFVLGMCVATESRTVSHADAGACDRLEATAEVVIKY